MKNEIKALFGIYIRKVLPWLITMAGIILLLFVMYPYFYDGLAESGDTGILYSIRTMLKHTFVIEIALVYFLSYFLYYTAVGESEHIFLGSLPVSRKQQYLCMAGSIFFVILCSVCMENMIARILWDSQRHYIGGFGSAICRLMLLLFATCFFLWLFSIFPIHNWWYSILILMGLGIFVMFLIRISISASYLFGSKHNIMYYQLKNIWFCLTDFYTAERNPADLEVYSSLARELYAQRGKLTVIFCLLFVFLTVIFLLLGARNFCRYGYLGKLKKWNSRRARLLTCCIAIWVTAYIGAMGSMEATWYQECAYYIPVDGEYDVELISDWSDIWFISHGVIAQDIPYEDKDLLCTYEEITGMLLDRGSTHTIRTMALTDKDRISLEGKMEISAWDPGMVYCIPRTKGRTWAKLQFFISLGLGAVLGFGGGMFQYWKKFRHQSETGEN